jgi:hypothetical protein
MADFIVRQIKCKAGGTGDEVRAQQETGLRTASFIFDGDTFFPTKIWVAVEASEESGEHTPVHSGLGK